MMNRNNKEWKGMKLNVCDITLEQKYVISNSMERKLKQCTRERNAEYRMKTN